MARIDQTEDWRNRHAPTISTFESLALEAYGHLPEEFRALTGNLIIEISDFPTDDVFEDMALPESQVLGPVGQGFAPMQLRLTVRRLEIGSWCVGTAQRCLDMMVEYAKQRVTFGQRLADRQAFHEAAANEFSCLFDSILIFGIGDGL